MSGSMLEIRHLRLVRAIAEEGGPTRAAARLHLTQSAVSHQLSELEARLGLVLFERVRRQLVLTAAGTRLLEASRRLLSDLDKVERDLHRKDSGRPLPLRLCVETFTSYHWLPKLAAAVAAEHPRIDLQMIPAARSEPVAALLRGELELAITSSPVQDRSLVVTPVAQDEWTVILPPDHELARKKFIAPDELASYLVFTHDAPRSDVERLRDIAAAGRSPLPAVKIVPLTDTLVDFVAAGLGLGMVSRWAVSPALMRGAIVARRFTRAGLREQWSAVYRRDAANRFPVGRIVELLRGQLDAKAP
ncbi:MAG TPA: LysR family transcriptional regulator [Candidatus Binatia bacterium]|jgi:LysR family transcriptional regulator for metE and metH